MAEIRFRSRAALGEAASDVVSLTPLPEAALLLLGRAGCPAPEVPGARSVAPGQWLVTGREAADPAALAARLPDYAVVDQGHGRVGIAVADAGGGDARQGTAVDLDAMAVGATAATMLGPISVTLTKVAEAAFEIHVARSFARSLWQDLRAMAGDDPL